MFIFGSAQSAQVLKIPHANAFGDSERSIEINQLDTLGVAFFSFLELQRRKPFSKSSMENTAWTSYFMLYTHLSLLNT